MKLGMMKKNILFYGNFENLLLAPSRIRYTIAKNLDPTEFRPLIVTRYPSNFPGIYNLYQKDEKRKFKYLDDVLIPRSKGIISLFPIYRNLLEYNLSTVYNLGVELYRSLKNIKTKIDIFHSNCSQLSHGIYQILKKNNPKLKLIVTFYGFFPNPYIFNRANFKFIRKADSITCVSKTTAKQIKKYYSMDSSVIYDGVNVQLFFPGKKKNKRTKIIFVGRLDRRKRPELFIKMAKRFPKCDFILKTNRLNQKRSEFLRNRPKNLKVLPDILSRIQMAELYQTSDIFFLPSIREGFSNSLLEAAASGLPAVVSNSTSFWEFIKNGKQGFRCDSFDEMIDKLQYLIENPEIRENMGEMARLEAEKYRWEKIIPQYEELYRNLY